MKNLQRSIILLMCISVLGTAFAGCASTTKHESTGQYVDDSVITAKVKAAILEDKAVKVTQVNVETYRGIVQLSGFVDNPEMAKKAEEDARKVAGVREVKNNIIVK